MSKDASNVGILIVGSLALGLFSGTMLGDAFAIAQTDKHRAIAQRATQELETKTAELETKTRATREFCESFLDTNTLED